MEELLPEVCTWDDAEPEAKIRCSRRSPDIFTWLQCFGVYTSVRGAQFPEQIPELMAYMGTIIKVIREYTGSEWAKYDMLFHKHAALRRETRWSVINPTIYARCFTAATRSPSRCEVCLASTHDTREYSQRDVDEGDIEGRLRNMERTIQNLPHPHCETSYNSRGKSAESGTRGSAGVHIVDTLTSAARAEGLTLQFAAPDVAGWVQKASLPPGDPTRTRRDHKGSRPEGRKDHKTDYIG